MGCRSGRTRARVPTNNGYELNAVSDEFWMRQALELARYAEAAGETPVGAVVVINNECIAEGWNQPISNQDPSAHAEIVAIRGAADRLRNYRLPGTTLYVTLEPCAMCAGAVIQARIARLVYAAADPRSGAAGSVFNILQCEQLNHRVELTAGVLKREAAEILQRFFRSRR